MPDAQASSPSPTERFNKLWDEIGAKRITIGSADKGFEITVDADLSIFGILEKLKEAAESGHARGEISDAEKKAVGKTLEDTARSLSGGLHDKLREQVEKLAGKRR